MGGAPSCCYEEPAALPVEITSVPPEAEAEEPEAQRAAVSNKWSRMENHRHLEVDVEILRGISLSESLKQRGILWRRSPMDMSKEETQGLWDQSKPVVGYDIFLSHTWLTDGRRKVLALTFQSGWRLTLLSWALWMLLAEVLVLTNVLPMPFRYQVDMFDFQGEIHFSFWPMLFGGLGTLLGLLSSPYVNSCFEPTMCFLDVVSIHQTDQELMERGIYGLGGFLSVSKELRVLWSTPYLSRLWCVFELAAYRTANPEGKILLKPLFVEIGVIATMLGIYLAGFLFWVGLALNLNQDFLVLEMIALSPIFLLVHLLRFYMSEKYQLLMDLKHFDLRKVFCRTEFDKNFIYSAISDWYGSEDAFMRYVRGPLREELLTQGTTEIPVGYFVFLSSCTFAASMNTTTALMKASAPLPCVLAELLGSGFGFYVFWFVACLKLQTFLTQRFVMPCFKGRLMNYLQSLLLYLVFFGTYSGGYYVADFAYKHSLEYAIYWMIFSFFCCLASLYVPRCVDALGRSLAQAL